MSDKHIKTYEYMVVYMALIDGIQSHGNASYEVNYEIQTFEDIKQIQEMLKSDLKAEKVFISWYKLMNPSPSEQNTCVLTKIKKICEGVKEDYVNSPIAQIHQLVLKTLLEEN